MIVGLLGLTDRDVSTIKWGSEGIGRRVWTGAFECDAGGLAFRELAGCGGGEVDGGEEYGGCGGEELHCGRMEWEIDDWVRRLVFGLGRREMLGGLG